MSAFGFFNLRDIPSIPIKNPIIPIIPIIPISEPRSGFHFVLLAAIFFSARIERLKSLESLFSRIFASMEGKDVGKRVKKGNKCS